MTLRRDNKTGIPGLPYDERRGKWNVRVGNSSYGYFENKELALAVRNLIITWPDAAQGVTSRLAELKQENLQ